MDDAAVKIISALGVSIQPAMSAIETLKKEIDSLNTKVSATKLTIGSSGIQTGSITVQQAFEQGVLKQNEAQKAAIVAKGEAEISAIRAKEALARQKIITEEARAELLAVQKSNEQIKQSYMQARTATFADGPNLLQRHMSWLISGAGIYEGLSLIKEGVVGVDKAMANLRTVLPQLNQSQTAYNEAEKETIDLMQKWGASLDDVSLAARNFGRMYKDTQAVMGLVNNSILLNVLDQVNLEDAVKGNEAALATYGKTLKSTNEILAFSGKLMDSITRLAHESMATGTDLVQILQQTSSAAKNAGVSLDELLGLSASITRATGLQGAGGNLGRALRTAFTQLSVPTKDVEKSIEAIGVKMRDINTGKLRDAYDILLDLSLATKDVKINSEDMSKAIEEAASGKFQYNKISALVGSFQDIVKNTAISLNSMGKSEELAAEQMETITRKAGQLKATLVGMFSGAGDQGLRSALKGLIDAVNQFLLGIDNASPTVINFGLLLGGVAVGVKVLTSAFNYLKPVIATVTGIEATQVEVKAALTAGIIAEAEATEVLTAAESTLATVTAVATAGISIIIGALATMAYMNGEAARSEQELAQSIQQTMALDEQRINQEGQVIDFLDKMNEKHKELTDKLATLKEGTKEYNDVASERQAVEDAVGLAIDGSIKKEVELQGTWDNEISKAKELTQALRDAAANNLEIQIQQTNDLITQSNKRIDQLQNEVDAYDAAAARESALNPGSHDEYMAVRFGNKVIGHLPFKSNVGQADADLKAEQAKNAQLQQDLAQNKLDLAKYKGDLEDNSSGGGGSPSGGGSSAQNNWLEQFIKDAEAAADAQDKLNASTQRGIDSQEALNSLHTESAMTAGEYFQGLKDQANTYSLLEQKQEGLHKEADFYRAALVKLEEAQANVDTSTEEGQAAYSKFGDEIENVQGKIDGLGKEYVSIEAKQRGIYSGQVKDMINQMDKMVDLGAMTSEEELEKLSTMKMENMALAEQYEYTKKLDDLMKKVVQDEVDKRVAAITAEKKAYDDLADSRIASLQAELDLMNEQNDVAQEQQEIQDAQDTVNSASSDLSTAQTKLSNVQAEKNTRVFQNGRWDYIADSAAIKSAQDEVKSAQDKLLDAQQSFNDKMDSINQKHAQKALQDQIAAENDQKTDFDKSKDAEIKTVQDKGKELLANVAKNDAEMNAQIVADLKTLGVSFDDGLTAILGKAQTWASQVQSLVQSTLKMANEAGVPIGNTNTGTPEVEGANATGGLIRKTGLYLDHEGEYIWTASEVLAAGGVSGIERMKTEYNSPFLSSISNASRTTNNSTSTKTSSTKVDQSVNLNGPISFPNVYDWPGMARQLKGMAKIR